MPELSLEEFKRIKQRLNEIADIINAIDTGSRQLTDEEEIVLGEELGSIGDTLHNSDLSNIPFEEYEGFIYLGFDLSGTGANLDFSLIDMNFSYGDPVRVKGCHVRNFDFQNLGYDRDSFDEEFIEEHKDEFIDRTDLPEEVMQHFYHRNLTIREIVQYGLYDYMNRTHAHVNAELFFEKISPEVARKIDRRIVEDPDVWDLLEDRIMVRDVPMTEEEIDETLREEIDEKISGPYLYDKTYHTFLRNGKVRELGLERKLIDFPEEKRDLENRFLNGELSLYLVYANRDLFKEKDFVFKLREFKYDNPDRPNLTEDQILYFFDHFDDFAKELLYEGHDDFIIDFISRVDPKLSLAENEKQVQDRALTILREEKESYEFRPIYKKALERFYSFEALKGQLSETDQAEIDKILSQASSEELREYGITPTLLQNYGLRNLFSTYGVKTVMEFDRQNGGIFSKNDFELGKNIYEYYMHYGYNTHDSGRSVFERSDSSFGEPYSMEDFEEIVRRMIVYGPTNGNYADLQPIDYRNFTPEFKTRHPEMFLPDIAPQDLQDKFYSRTISLEDFKAHEQDRDWVSCLENVDLTIGMNFPRYHFYGSYGYESLIGLLRKTGANNREVLDFLIDNSGGLLALVDMKNIQLDIGNLPEKEDFSLDDLKEFIDTNVEQGIMSGRIKYTDEKTTQSFRDSHPEFFLSDDAPLDLKMKFYPGYTLDSYLKAHRLDDKPMIRDANSEERFTLSFDDLANPEYIEFLKGKDLSLTNNPVLKRVAKVFDTDTIVKLNQIDSDALKNVYSLSDENLNTLKELLDAKQYSPEDIMRYPGYFLAYPPEKRTPETLIQYKSLTQINMLKNTNHFARQTYEQILGHMLDFLGYDEAKKMLEVPEIDEESLSHIYEQDELIKSLYDKRYDVSGNIRVLAKAFEGIPALLPENEKITSKNSCKIFQSINKKIQEGYTGDFRTMIVESLEENGFEVDEQKVDLLVKNVIDVSTDQKLDEVREHNSRVIEERMEGATPKTKQMLKLLYRKALEDSLKKCEKVDPDLVREYLVSEFSKPHPTVPGQPRYSPEVSGRLDDLVSLATELSNDPNWGKMVNHTIVDDLHEESSKIGKGWIRKITSYACYKLDKLTYEEATNLDKAIYPEGSDLEVDTKASIGLRELTEEERKKLYELLTNGQLSGFLTYAKAESMFSAMSVPKTDKFKDFFLAHKEEFLSNPELFANFPAIASKFDEWAEKAGFNTRLQLGTVEPKELVELLKNEKYPHAVIHKGEHELYYQAKEAGLSEDQFLIAQKLMADTRTREYQTVPQEQAKTKRFRGRIVRLDDPLHYAVGKITDCCQTIGVGQPGETSMIHSATERNGSLFIVEELDEFGKPVEIVAQSWTWRNGNRICFDNVEIPHQTERRLHQEGGFDEIMEVYQETARRMIETDRLKLRKLVEQGKITEEQYRKMVVLDVAMGTNCDDLVHNISEEKRKTIDNISTILPLESGKQYTGAHTRTLYSDSSGCKLMAHNEEFAKDDHSHINIEVGDYGVKYTKTRDIFRRKGGDIDPDKIDAIASLVQKNGETQSAFASSPISILEIAHSYGDKTELLSETDKYRLSMSENADWYLFAEEQEAGIAILESGIDLTKPVGELETLDRKMAIGEYTREVYKLIQEAKTKGKNVILDQKTQEKFVNLDILINDGIVTIENGVIIVQDEAKLQEKIDTYDKVLEKQRRERLLLEPEAKEDKQEEQGEDRE